MMPIQVTRINWKEGDAITCEHLPGGDLTASSNVASEESTSELQEASEVTSTNEFSSSEEATTSSDEVATTAEATSSDNEQGGELPDTATVLPLGILGGLGAMALGALGLHKRK